MFIKAKNGFLLGWRSGLLLLMVAGSMGLTSCKEEDTDPPAVSLGEPGSGFSVEANTEFRIAGRATDDREVTQVTAILFDTQTETVVRTHSESLEGPRVDFDFMMPAGDRYTPGGEYTLMVTAMDAAENTGSAFQQITVQELPLEFRGVYWAGQGGGNLYQVGWRDTSAVVHTGPGGLYSLSDLLVDSRNDQVVATQSLDGAIWGWDATDFTNIFQVNLSEGMGTETFSGVSNNRKGYYCSVRVPSYLRGYRSDGSVLGEFDDAVYPGTAVLATADRVYLGQRGVLGTPMKLDVYDANTRALQATQVVDWTVGRIVEVNEEQIAVSGNMNGMGQILVLDRGSLVRNEETELTDSIVDMVSGSGRVWVLTESGLYEYFVASGTLSSVLVSGTYSALGIDAASVRIFLGKQDAIEVRTGAGSLVEEIMGSFGAVRFIRSRYNK
ncbi:MAG: hypothetical protein U0176_12155 [Bacteroidia bacterium]